MKVDTMTHRCFAKSLCKVAGIALLAAVSQDLFAQTKIDLTSLSAFQSPANNWHIAGDVRADLTKNDVLIYSPGTGVLVSQAEEGTHGADLLFNTRHGDMDLELDYMMAKGSNSGIYMQGRYEIQLLDSWGAISPTSADNGGIYERWNTAKPAGQEGFEGHAPRQNAGQGSGAMAAHENFFSGSPLRCLR